MCVVEADRSLVDAVCQIDVMFLRCVSGYGPRLAPEIQYVHAQLKVQRSDSST